MTKLKVGKEREEKWMEGGARAQGGRGGERVQGDKLQAQGDGRSQEGGMGKVPISRVRVVNLHM